MAANGSEFVTLSQLKTSIDSIDTSSSSIDAYPVGSIYMSVNSTSPASLFGGTWQQIKDRFLMCAGSTYKAGGTGGEASHTLTVKEMPSHSHDVSMTTRSWPTNSALPKYNLNITWEPHHSTDILQLLTTKPPLLVAGQPTTTIPVPICLRMEENEISNIRNIYLFVKEVSHGSNG